MLLDNTMSFSGGAVTGLVLAVFLMFVIIAVQVCVRLNRYRINRQQLMYRERRTAAIRTAVADNQVNEEPDDRFDPPDYWQCVHDNAGFVADEGAEKQQDSKLPSYENYIKGDFVEYKMSETMSSPSGLQPYPLQSNAPMPSTTDEQHSSGDATLDVDRPTLDVDRSALECLDSSVVVNINDQIETPNNTSDVSNSISNTATESVNTDTGNTESVNTESVNTESVNTDIVQVDVEGSQGTHNTSVTNS